MSSRRQFSVSQMRLRIVVVTSSPLESLVSVQVEMPTARRISVRVMPRSINSFQSRLYETPYLTSFQKDTAYIMSNFQFKNQTQSFFVGCDSKVLKHSAGGVATRRARPIRFVRGLAAGFAPLVANRFAAPAAGDMPLRAFPSKAALSSAHFRPARFT